MEMMIGNGLSPLISSREIAVLPAGIVDVSSISFRPAERARNCFRGKSNVMRSLNHTDWVKYVAPESGENGFKVLLIGDESSGQNIRITLASHLTIPINFQEAKSGQFALRILGRDEVDLIIFGDGTADMDGLEFLERLNRQCGNKKVPVIEILNPEAIEVGVKAMKMGAHDYLLKDSDGYHFELLPIFVSRVYAEKQTMSVLHKTAGVQQSIADSIPSVIYQLSLQGGHHDISISPQILELGFSQDKWGNDTELHHQMCHVEDRSTVRQALEHSYRTGTNFQCEYRINTEKNSLRWFHDKARVIMDKYGRPLFLQGVMTDITSFKALESELQHYRNMFDILVRDKTQRLERRVSILEACNSSLGDNYHKVYQMYLDLLVKAQACEGTGSSA